jgi:hypothetical protein
MNTEHYGVHDIMGTMGQLGLLPPAQARRGSGAVSSYGRERLA